ncbi:MAG: hypothetical protein WC455_11880 [Dehalococcoidia bacterium]|jgi:hypothetical protein
MPPKTDDKLELGNPVEGSGQSVTPPIEGELTTPPADKTKLPEQFKSVEALIESYKELERKHTTTSQERAALEKERQKLLKAVDAVKQNGQWELDEEGNWVQVNPPAEQPVTTTTTTSGNPAAEDFRTKFSDEFYEDPLGTLNRYTQGIKQLEKAATANRERAMSKFKNDPLYQLVEGEFKASLVELDDTQMANPQQAAYLAEQVYNNVTGRYARQELTKAGDNPEERLKVLRHLGIEEPQPTPSSGIDNLYPASQIGKVQNGLGLSEEQIKRAKERAEKLEKGEM